MEVINYKKFKEDMSNLIDIIEEKEKPLVVTGDDKQKSFIVLSVDFFNGLWETATILSNEKDREDLKKILECK